MKYAISLLCLLVFAGCTKQPPSTYFCFNPVTIVQSFQVDTDHPRVKVRHDTLELTTDDGNVIIVPKSLCVEVKHAATN